MKILITNFQCMSINNLRKNIDKTIKNVMRVAVENDFDENMITGNLLLGIQKIFTIQSTSDKQIKGLKIEYPNNVHKFVSLEAFKVRGNAEQQFGDVLGILNLETGGIFFVGMFSLEAKILEQDKMKSFNYPQLNNLLRQNPFIKWLIYDKDRIDIKVLNPRILLGHSSGKPTMRAIDPLSFLFSLYFTEFLLNANDAFLFVKVGSNFKYLSFNPRQFNSISELITFYLNKVSKLEGRRPPLIYLNILFF